MTDYDDQSLNVSGSVHPGPAPTENTSFNPGGGCNVAPRCLAPGTDPDEGSELGYCLADDNQATNVVACVDAACEEGHPVRIVRRASERRVCLRACGAVSGNAAPTCDPRYGCIDF